MKKIIFLLLVFVITWDVYSQTTRAATSGFVPRANQTFVVEDGILSARNGLFAPRYTDTTQANTFIFKDTAGNVIYTYATQSLWVRVNETASNNKWVAVGGGGGSGTVTSVSGTANQIAVATGTTTPVISLVTGGTLPGAWNLGTPSALVGTNISGTAAALSIGGNAATATALQTGRTISISGDLTYTSPSFDGTGNVTAAGTLATVNSNVGTFGSATQVPQLTVNAKGLITAVSNVTITVPTASLLPITGTGTATGAVIGSLAGNTVNIQQGANPFLTIDPTTNAEEVTLRAYNTTGSANQSRFNATTTDILAEAIMQGVFNGGAKEFSLSGSVSAVSSTISASADQIQLTGNVGVGVIPTVLFQVQSGGNDLIKISESGTNVFIGISGTNQNGLNGASTGSDASATLYAWYNNEAKSASIQAFANVSTGTLAYVADTHTFTGNVGIGVTPIVLFQVQSGGENLLIIDADTEFRSYLESTDLTAMGYLRTRSDLVGGFVNFDLRTTDGTGSPVTITGDGINKTLAYSADTHTFTGNILTATNNTYDIGDATNSFKDIYSRTLKLDGSTSGTVTFLSDALSNAPNGTTLSGTGYVAATMFSRLTSNHTMSDVNTVQAVFSSGQDVWTLQASTTYRFRGKYYLTHGAVSHSVGMSFELGGGASVTDIDYSTICWVTVANTNTASQTTNNIRTTANTSVNAAGANAQETIIFEGWLTMNAGGTVTPSITFSAAPGGAPAAVAYSTWIEFEPIATNTATSLGNVN